MNLAPYLDNEKIATVLRAVRSGDQQWIHDSLTFAREEPRLERVCDYIEQNLSAGTQLDTAPPQQREANDTPPDTGNKGGEAGTDKAPESLRRAAREARENRIEP